MRWPDRLRLKWRSLLRRDHVDHELDRELRFHLEQQIQENIGAGMSPEVARFAALRTFGNIAELEERCRDARGLNAVDDVLKDVGYALRTLLANPTFAIVAVLTLALGIGATTAIFSVIRAVLLQPLPYKDADRLVRIVENVPAAESFRGVPTRTSGMNPDDFAWWRSRTKTLSHMAAVVPTSFTMISSDGTVRLSGARVSPAWFDIRGVPPVLGRWLHPNDERPGANVIVLSTATWRRHFDADLNVLNRTIVLDGRPYSIVGVMPPELGDTALWMPFIVEPSRPGVITIVTVLSRLRDGISVDDAAAEINVLGHQVRDRPVAGSAARFEVVRLQDETVAPVKPALRMLALAVGVVLLIVCANLANLLLVRGTNRQREIGIRRALGAGRGRIVRQVLTESVVLSIAGGVAGAALAGAAVHLLKSLTIYDLPERFRGALGPAVLDTAVLPRVDEVVIDVEVLAFSFGVALVTGLLFGLAPALRLSRVAEGQVISGANVATRLAGLGQHRAGHLLAIVQLMLATTLLVGTGLLLHSLVKLSGVDVGFNRDVVSFELVLPQQYSPLQKVALAQDLTERLRALPMVEAVGFTNRPPLSGSSWSGPVAPPNRDWRNIATDEMTLIRSVSPDYLRALGVTLLEGRWLDERDRRSGVTTALVNRAYARRFFQATPVGSVLRWGTVGSFEVIGVVDDIRLNLPSSPDAAPERVLFVDPRQLLPELPLSLRETQENLVGGAAGTVSFAIRVPGDPLSVMLQLRRAVREVDPALAIEGITTMEHVFSTLVARPRFYAVLLTIFGGIAAFIAAIGVYGVMAYGVTQRTREIGIRIALGARPREVLALVLRQGIFLVATGIALGLVCAVGFTQYLSSILFGLTPLDPPTYAVVALTFIAVAMLASYLPARRATKVNPVVALRYE